MKARSTNMKKSVKFMIASFCAVSVLMTGCSLSSGDVEEAREFVTDKEESTTADSSDLTDPSGGNNIVVIDNLFEPDIENSSEAATEASSQEETTEVSDNSSSSDKPVNIVCFGDSQLANGKNDGTDIPHLIGARVPNSRIYNMAIGGTTATVEQSTSNVSASALHSTSFLGMSYCFTGKSDRNETLANYLDVLEIMNSIEPADVDYYILSYGTNDFFNNMPLDTSMYSTEGEKAHALYNAMQMAVNNLKEASPNAEIIVMTPFYGIYVADDGTYIGDSYIVSNGVGTLADYADKVKNVAEDTGLVIFDGMNHEKFDLYLDTASQYLMDNLHLSLTGRQIVARLLAHEVNFAEKNEPYAYLETDRIEIATFDPDEYYRYDEGLMKEYYPESWEKYITGMFPLAQPSPEAAAEYNGG